ncbi:hypothetical protein [Pseudomonas sp. UMAB-40]|uniref:hypothetical protein n=1 Tax=Pseudomonas sp. UMAB-40 TaxID=1365407 RepID=UPI001C583A6F|nr:hypothetical protein [Pseudomonas sp. UMAB-40]
MSSNETPEQIKKRKLDEIQQYGEKLLAPNLDVRAQLRGMGYIEGRFHELKEAGLVTWEEAEAIERGLAYRLGWRAGEW